MSRPTTSLLLMPAGSPESMMCILFSYLYLLVERLKSLIETPIHPCQRKVWTELRRADRHAQRAFRARTIKGDHAS
jgi:hypothetical protein